MLTSHRLFFFEVGLGLVVVVYYILVFRIVAKQHRFKQVKVLPKKIISRLC